MNETAKIIFGLVGGLAMFLFGMNSMSDALQKAAGEKMKKVLSFLTKNPLMGALAGALVTAVLQFGDDGYGDRICKCGTYEPAAGDIRYLWREYWDDHDSTADGI